MKKKEEKVSKIGISTPENMEIIKDRTKVIITDRNIIDIISLLTINLSLPRTKIYAIS